LWFGVYATAESLLAQLGAAVFVIGSYYLARRSCAGGPKSGPHPHCIVPDCDRCETAAPRAQGPTPLGLPKRKH
jgi:hypothetical protein